MTSQTVVLPLSEVRELVEAALTALGLGSKERPIVADVLLWAELRGNSQGLSKIPARAVVADPEAGEIIVTHRSPVVTQIEGNGNLGMVVMDRAVEESLKSAESNGIGIAGTRGTATSTGAIGYFAERAAKRGYLCMIFGGTPKAVAPFGSVDAIFGTNPLSFAVPTDGCPLILDMGTSAITWFGLIQSERLGESIEDDLAFDAAGNATTDPGEALRGAIRAFGGAKGSGLALLIEVLTGPLAGGAIVGDEIHQSGNVVITLDPDLFGFGSEFSSRTASLIDRIRKSRPVSGGDRPQIPGERSRDNFDATTRQGRVRLDKKLVAAIQAIVDA